MSSHRLHSDIDVPFRSTNRTTTTDVAASAGVSTALVSLVVRGGATLRPARLDELTDEETMDLLRGVR